MSYIINNVYGYEELHDGSFTLAVNVIEKDGVRLPLEKIMYFTISEPNGVMDGAARNLINWYKKRVKEHRFEGNG